jgi:hypothetical protein
VQGSGKNGLTLALEERGLLLEGLFEGARDEFVGQLEPEPITLSH